MRSSKALPIQDRWSIDVTRVHELMLFFHSHVDPNCTRNKHLSICFDRFNKKRTIIPLACP